MESYVVIGMAAFAAVATAGLLFAVFRPLRPAPGPRRDDRRM